MSFLACGGRGRKLRSARVAQCEMPKRGRREAGRGTTMSCLCAERRPMRVAQEPAMPPTPMVPPDCAAAAAAASASQGAIDAKSSGSIVSAPGAPDASKGTEAAEVAELRSRFLATVNKHPYGYPDVVEIDRIEPLHNPKLQKRYAAKRAEWSARRVGGLPVPLNEELVFHGTPTEANLESILKVNLSCDRVGETTGNRGWYGAGMYVTRHAAAALRYNMWVGPVLDRKQDFAAPRRMLVCRVLLGRTFEIPENSVDFVGSCKEPGFDSHRGRDRWDVDWQLCLFDSAQVVPAYIVHYRHQPHKPRSP
jgi:hypothetical protein